MFRVRDEAICNRLVRLHVSGGGLSERTQTIRLSLSALQERR